MMSILNLNFIGWILKGAMIAYLFWEAQSEDLGHNFSFFSQRDILHLQ